MKFLLSQNVSFKLYHSLYFFEPLSQLKMLTGKMFEGGHCLCKEERKGKGIQGKYLLNAI